MKTISLAVSERSYQAFREASRQQGRPIAQIIREAMDWYRREHLETRVPLTELPLLAGHRAIAPLPTRTEIYDEIGAERNR